MTAPSWAGNAVPWSILLGTFAILAPVLLAWLCARTDVESPSDETYEVAEH